MLSQKTQEATMLSHAISGKFGKNVKIAVSDESKEEFRNLADILISNKGLDNIKTYNKEDNEQRKNGKN